MTNYRKRRAKCMAKMREENKTLKQEIANVKQQKTTMSKSIIENTYIPTKEEFAEMIQWFGENTHNYPIDIFFVDAFSSVLWRIYQDKCKNNNKPLPKL